MIPLISPSHSINGRTLWQIPDDPLSIINDKDDKEEFEDLADDVVRVIGWFEPGSDALEEFEEAAEEFMGEVEFFAVVDSYWARRMGLEHVGDVEMYRPFEKEPLQCPDAADTEDEFEDWVEDNMEPVMMKLTKTNFYNVWVRHLLSLYFFLTLPLLMWNCRRTLRTTSA